MRGSDSNKKRRGRHYVCDDRDAVAAGEGGEKGPRFRVTALYVLNAMHLEVYPALNRLVRVPSPRTFSYAQPAAPAFAPITAQPLFYFQSCKL